MPSTLPKPSIASADQPVRLLVLRHGVTAWNQTKRLQGRCDIPLSEAGRQALQQQQLPPEYQLAPWFVSPLLRAQQSAQALGINAIQATPELIEMDWGDWEGERLPDLRQRLGEAMRREEQRGLDLQPPGGESPRQVRARILAWLRTTPFTTLRAGLLTHKGVIRALLSAALDWDMRSDCPVKVRWNQALEFEWQPGQQEALRLLHYNLSLAADGSGNSSGSEHQCAPSSAQTRNS